MQFFLTKTEKQDSQREDETQSKITTKTKTKTVAEALLLHVKALLLALKALLLQLKALLLYNDNCDNKGQLSFGILANLPK